MSTKVQPTKERCASCGGALRTNTMTHEERPGPDLCLFQAVKNRRYLSLTPRLAVAPFPPFVIQGPGDP